MILQKEIRDIASSWDVPPDTVDKDYVLGHFLAGFHHYFGDQLVFKGGTCLRKCYFPGYRFSEDLDFTSRDGDFALTQAKLEAVGREVHDHCGLLFHVEDVTSLVHRDQQKGFQVKIRYWGANHSKHEPPPSPGRWLTKIKLEISTDELLVTQPELRPIHHPYSDALLQDAPVACYAIDEILGEKLRSLVQSSYMAPRDIYDIYRLTNDFSNEDWQRILPVFKEKMEHKRLTFKNVNDLIDETSLERVRRAWDRSMVHQIPGRKTGDRDTIIESVVERIKAHVTGSLEVDLPTILKPERESEAEVFYESIQEFQEDLKSLVNDWDESGALAPVPANVDNACHFLLEAFQNLQKGRVFLKIPEMNACPDGSVDVVWRTHDAFMLINFRNPEEHIAYYYFDQYNDKLGRQGGIQLNQQIPEDIQLYLKAVSA